MDVEANAATCLAQGRRLRNRWAGWRTPLRSPRTSGMARQCQPFQRPAGLTRARGTQPCICRRRRTATLLWPSQDPKAKALIRGEPRQYGHRDTATLLRELHRPPARLRIPAASWCMSSRKGSTDDRFGLRPSSTIRAAFAKQPRAPCPFQRPYKTCLKDRLLRVSRKGGIIVCQRWQSKAHSAA